MHPRVGAMSTAYELASLPLTSMYPYLVALGVLYWRLVHDPPVALKPSLPLESAILVLVGGVWFV